ncbi:hypothetical protein P3T69_00625 (plasmid) [Lactiplantibacillus plantarum]|nr:hypothetical protein P3T69_00625 [Lactiplantibacillus plantarum]
MTARRWFNKHGIKFQEKTLVDTLQN